MKKLIVYGLLCVVFFLSGCVTRIIPREVDRVDQELKGNRGVIQGAANLPIPERKKTRTIYDFEIELGSSLDARKAEGAQGGNKGYVETKTVPEKKARPIKKRVPAAQTQLITFPTAPQVVYQKGTVQKERYTEKKKEPRIYIVEKGDTLQKISRKAYGTTKRWKKIYNANRKILKSPDMIKPGQELVIPAE